MIVGYKPIRTVIAGLYRDLGSTTEINELDVVEWCAEALSMIGAYSQYVEKSDCINVCNHQADLPLGFYRLKEIAYNTQPLMWGSLSLVNNYACEGCQIPTCCTDESFHISEHKLKTSFKEGKVCITYLSIVVDEEGYPMIPDDVYFDKALKAYCTYMLDRIDFRKGKLPERAYRDSEQDWLFYVNSARGSANMPSLAQLENLKNNWVRMIPQQDEYRNFFRNYSNPERRKLF